MGKNANGKQLPKFKNSIKYSPVLDISTNSMQNNIKKCGVKKQDPCNSFNPFKTQTV